MFTDEAPPVETLGAATVDCRILSAEFDSVVEKLSPDEQLARLTHLLVALRASLSTGIMPRAARLTGTSDRLFGAVNRVDEAILVAKGVVSQLQQRT